MNDCDKKQPVNTQEMCPAEVLYVELSQNNKGEDRCRTSELSEGISVVSQSICGWWKQRYLIDNNRCRAYEIMNKELKFVNFTPDDVDWESIEDLPARAKKRAQGMSANFPTFVGSFLNGVAQVSWQLNPDGRYYMDGDGYGMTDDEEITVYGFIDVEMNVLVKFQYIGEDYKRLKDLRVEAERKKDAATAKNPLLHSAGKGLNTLNGSCEQSQQQKTYISRGYPNWLGLPADYPDENT